MNDANPHQFTVDYFYNEVELKIIQDEESYSYSPVCGKAVMIMMMDPSH